MSMQTCHYITADTLIVDLGKPYPVLSSAPRGGGFGRFRFILNHRVRSNPVLPGAGSRAGTYEDPGRYLGRLATRLGLERQCVGLMTAVPLRHLVCGRAQQGDLWVEAFCTVGLSNAVQAGEPISNTRDGFHAGTINIVLVTNGRLASSAMVGAIQVATESKTAAVVKAGIQSCTGRRYATGTGTDATVIACGQGPFCRYSGSHTALGSMIGQVIEQAITEGIEAWLKWRSHDLDEMISGSVHFCP